MPRPAKYVHHVDFPGISRRGVIISTREGHDAITTHMASTRVYRLNDAFPAVNGALMDRLVAVLDAHGEWSTERYFDASHGRRHLMLVYPRWIGVQAIPADLGTLPRNRLIDFICARESGFTIKPHP